MRTSATERSPASSQWIFANVTNRIVVRNSTSIAGWTRTRSRAATGRSTGGEGVGGHERAEGTGSVAGVALERRLETGLPRLCRDLARDLEGRYAVE